MWQEIEYKVSLFEFFHFSGCVLADVIGWIVHAQNATIDGEEGSVEALRNGAVEILAFVFRHHKNNLVRIGHVMLLNNNTHTISTEGYIYVSAMNTGETD